MNVAILIYPGVEVIDMNGPVDVFVKANRLNFNKYKIFTVAESEDVIETEASVVRVTPEYTIDNCPRADVIVIPGQIMPLGSPRRFGKGSEKLIAWLRKQAQDPSTTIIAVCVGVYILANTGLLTGKQATTHYAAIDNIQQEYNGITFIKNVRFISAGNFITTGGVTSGIDGILYFISETEGADTAQSIADTMVYNRDAPLPPNTILP